MALRNSRCPSPDPAEYASCRPSGETARTASDPHPPAAHDPRSRYKTSLGRIAVRETDGADTGAGGTPIRRVPNHNVAAAATRPTTSPASAGPHHPDTRG